MNKLYPFFCTSLSKFSLLIFFIFNCQLASGQAPTIPSTNFSVTDNDGNRFVLRFAAGDGAKRIIVASTNPVTAVPQNGTDYLADGTFGLGNEIKSGEFIVYEGNGSSMWIYGLNHSTTYYFRIYEFNGTDYNTEYLTTEYLDGSGTTLSGPTIQASDLTFSNVTGTSMSINWTNGDGSGRFLVARAGSPVVAEPQDLINYSSWTGAFNYSGSSSYSISTNDQKVLYMGSGSSTSIFNLDPNTTYYFALFEYNGNNGKIYLRPGATGNQITASHPTIASSGAYFTDIDGNRFIPRWTAGNGENRIVIARKGSAVTSVPVDGISYTANNNFGLGQELNPGEFVVYNGSGTSFWMSGLESSTAYHFAVFEYNGTGENTFYLKDPYLASSQSTLMGPTIQASDLTFSNVTGTSMSINWTNGDGSGRFLVARAGSPVVAEPQDLINYSSWTGAFNYSGSSSYSISTNDQKVLYMGSGSSTSIFNLDPNTTYYFALFEYNGNNGKIYLRPGATGNQITASHPTIASSGAYFTDIDGNRFIPRWTAGNGENRIVIARKGSAVTSVPVDGISYTANNNFGLGQELNPGEFVVYNGSGTSFWMSGLESSTAYHFAVFEYNGTGENTFYLKDPYLASSQSTLMGPTIQASDLTFSNVTGTSMSINWTNGDGSGRFLVARAGSPVVAEPQDLINYSSWTGAFNYSGSSSYSISTNDQKVLYMGSGSSTSIFNLDPNTTYYFALFEYNGNNGKIYLRPGATGNQITASHPTIASSGAYFTDIDGNRFIPRWTAGNGENRIVIARKGSAVTSVPVDGISYTANNNFGLGQELNPGEFVVYNGSGTSFWMSGLESSTAYHFAVFEYNGTGENTFYLKDPYLASSQSTLSSPTVQSSNAFLSSRSTTSLNVSWTKGDGSNRMLLGRKDGPVNVEPEDLKNYSAYSQFGYYPLGTTDNYVLYSGSNNNINITNLESGTNYHFALFEYNGSNGKLYLRPGYSFALETFGERPTVQVSNAKFTNIGFASLDVQFSVGNGSRRMVIVREGGPVSSGPADFTTYTANNTFGNGSEIGLGNFVVYNDFGENFSLEGLDPGKNYHFAFYEYAMSADGELYMAPPYTTSQTTMGSPSQLPTNFSVTDECTINPTITWTGGNGSGRIVVVSPEELDALPVNYFNYSANSVYGSGDSLGNGFVVYNGSAESVTLSGLQEFTNYTVNVFEYNGTVENPYFNTTSLKGNLGDLTAPLIEVIEEQTIAGDSECSATISDYTILAVVTDNCDSAPVVTQLPEVGTLINDTTLVTLTVTDAFGNSDEISFNVLISDETPPSIATIEDQVITLNSNCEALLSDFTLLAIVSDNCDDNPVISQSPVEGTQINESTLVTLSATDAAGNKSSVTFNVSIEKQSAPEIVCVTDQSVELVQDQCYYIHSGSGWDITTVSGCSQQNLQSDFSGDVEGWTKNTISDTSASVVFVSSGGNPEGFLRFNEPGQGTVDYFMAPSEFLGVKSEYYGGSISLDVKSNRTTNTGSMVEITGNGFTLLSIPDKPLQTWSSFNLSLLPGNWTIKGTGTSASEEEIRSVLENIQMIVVLADWYNGTEVTDMDNFQFIPGPPSYLLAGATTGTGNSLDGVKFNVGLTTVTWTAANSGGSSACSFIVTVEDKIFPTITSPAAVTANTSLDGGGNCTTKLDLGVPETNDNCTVESVRAFIEEQEIDPLHYEFSTGVTNVIWKVTDAAGNIISEPQEITILDDEVPVINTPEPVVITEDEAVNFVLSEPDASDNCGIASVTAFIGEQEIDLNNYIFGVGKSVVFWIAKDAAGNESTASQEIEVTLGCTLSLASASDYPSDQFVSPNQGSSATEFVFKAVFKSDSGLLPAQGFPRVELDANGDGDAFDPLDKIVVMHETDGTDLNSADGKEYSVSISGLSPMAWNSRIVAEGSNGCVASTSFVNKPFVSDNLLDVGIYASDISFSRSNPAIGEPIMIYARIKNPSDFPAEDFVVSLYAEDYLLSTQTVPLIPAQGSITLEWEQNFGISDFTPIKVVIDETNQLEEINELNNFAIRPIIVGDYVLPGGIEITASVAPLQVEPRRQIKISGNAVYFGIEDGVDPDVAGATIKASIEGGNSGETYSRSDGTFDLFLTVPDIPGIYTVNGEITDYTLSSSFGPLTFEVIEAAPMPDLISSIRLSKNTILQGDEISGVATVTNRGNSSADNFIFKYYNCEMVLGAENILSLAPGESLQFAFTTTVNAVTDCLNPGNCMFISQADQGKTVIESFENNNSGSSVITVLPKSPDLTPLKTSISTYHKLVEPVELRIRIDNIGGEGALTPFNVKVYSDQTLIHSEEIQSLKNCNNVSFIVNHQFSTTEDHTITIVVDEEGAVSEFRETNNSYTKTIKNLVVVREPNLNISASDLQLNPTLPGEAEDFEITANFRNKGTGDIATPFDIKFIVTENGVEREETITVSEPLSAGQTSSKSILTRIANYGNQKVKVLLDTENIISEQSEGDNIAEGPLCLDFKVSPTGGIWNGNFYRDTPQHLTAVLHNLGLFTGNNVNARFYLDDIEIAATTIPTSGPLSITAITIPYIFDEDGTFVLSVKVDDPDSNVECNEENNTYSRTIVVKPPLPDLRVISEYISPTELNPDLDEPINIFLSFENEGIMRSDAFIARVAVDDVQLGQDIEVPALNPGEDGTIAIAAPYSSATGGIRIIRGFVDPENLILESNETNNEASRAIIIGEAPNLLFTGLTSDINCPENGEMINIKATVENEGDLGTDAEIQFYYRTDTDTIPIETTQISVGANSIAETNIEWTVVNNTYSLYAEIQNTSLPEYDVLDNFISTEFCTIEQYAVKVNVQGQGIVRKNSDRNKYDINSKVELKAVAAQGWFFKNWTGDLTGNSNPAALLVESDKDITAIFERVPDTEFALRVDIQGSGVIGRTPEKDTYALNEEVVLEATPAEGYVFVGWIGDLISTQSTEKLVMDGNKSVSAVFVEELKVDANVTSSTCANLADGSISLTVTGGNLPYTFDWDNDGIGEQDAEPDSKDISNLLPGNYTVIVKDPNGLAETITAEVLAEESGTLFYADDDGDNLGDPEKSTLACAQPEGYVSNANDCDDTNADILESKTWYMDADGDGMGNKLDFVLDCLPPEGYVSNADDCDDSDDTTGAGVAWYVDADGDQYGDRAGEAVMSCTKIEGHVGNNSDCNDDDKTIHPGAAETPGDGIDQDCDGADKAALSITAPTDIYLSTCSRDVELGEPILDGASAEAVVTNDAPSIYSPGITTIVWTVKDGIQTATAQQQVNITNEGPEILQIMAPEEPQAITQEILLSASYTESNLATVSWNWGDGTTEPGTFSDGVASGGHFFNEPGVYTIILTLTDDCGASSSMEYEYVVVYDPSAGFVTGRGFIYSPPGSYVADPTLDGEANFGFVSKYRKGANRPEGRTQFEFTTGNFSFESTNYEWLIVAGTKAMFKGEGVVAGQTKIFAFLLSAIDDDELGDRFRIKIWEKSPR